MTFKAIAILALAGLTAGATAAPPQASPRPGAPSSDLVSTLTYIADELRQQGRINYAGAMHDSADNQSWVNNFNVEASNITVDPASCYIGYHWEVGVDGKQAPGLDTGFNFTTLQSVALTSMEQDVNRLAAGDGHTSWTGHVTPSIWVITTTSAGGHHNVVDFRDYAQAERIVTVMNHAMKLCQPPSRGAK